MRVKVIYFILGLVCFVTTNSSAQEIMSQEHQLPSLYNDDGDEFIVIAHRGASAYYPENTMAAFKGALAMDAEMIELDVTMSKDGVPVIFHDATLDDHSNGTGPVGDYTLKELKKLDAGSWFDTQYSDQQIPTLKEVLDFASGNIALNIEIKTEAVSDQLEDGIEEKCLKLVTQYGMENHVLFSSFDYRAVSHLKKLNTNMPVALLYNNNRSNKKLPHELIDQYKADAFNCSFRQLKRRWINDLRDHNIPSFIYTVNSESRMRKLIRTGVSGIFTNKPDVLHRVVKNYRK